MNRSVAIECMLGGLMSVAALALQNSRDSHDVEIPREAVAVLIATEGNNVRGVVLLRQEDEHVHVLGRVAGLQPGQQHAFHIHEYGDLRSPTGASAGDHYDPEGTKHGKPGHPPHHAGDLGNIHADAEGVANIDERFDFFKLHHVIGRSVVVHEGEDDFETQPSGDAGPRIAVGVIGIAQPQQND